MWRNYWTVAVRALAKNKTNSIINIAGLALGMAACVMILLYVHYEQGYDSWIPDVQNTYELQTWAPHPAGHAPSFAQMAPNIASNRIKKDFPQVTGAVYALSSRLILYKDGQASPATDYLIADDDFLKIVNLPLLAGTTLPQAQTAVLTRTEAVKRFGTDQVIGRTITLVSKGVAREFKITGVLKDVPKNSSLKLNAIVRMDFNSLFAGESGFLTCWDCQSGWVFLKLRPGTDPNVLQAQEPAWEKRNIPDQTEGNIRYNPGDENDWHFVNLQDVHLGIAQEGAMARGNDRKTIATFAIIATLILAMAIVNFMNIATARASQRAREVALRKVLGAKRKQLIVQFVVESIVISGIAMLLALALVELMVEPFAAFLNADLTPEYFGSGGLLLPAIGLALLVGIASGLYPAFFLSRFQPAQTLKANRSAAETPGAGRLRAVLVIAQFAISTGLIICTAVIYGQTVFARTADPGYERDHILQVENMGRPQLIPKGEAIAEQMKRIPGVIAVGRGGLGVATNDVSSTDLVPAGSKKPVTLGLYLVDTGFRDAMGLKLEAGRWFDPGRPADDSTIAFPPDPNADRALAARGVNVVLNRQAVRKLGFKSSRDAVGKVIRSELLGPDAGMANVTVVGVVHDSQFRSVRTPIEAVIFLNSRQGEGWMEIRYRGDPSTVEAAVERRWKQITNEVPFEAKFSENIVRDLYKAEDNRAKVFAAFALLAVIIGCLGLFGLAAFTAERRTKEIGIRKVLGARTRDILRLLVWQFSRPVIISNIIAWPIAWWVMRDWLNGFDQRIALTPAPFLLAGGIALAIAIFTVAGHAVRVARANPIHALRYE